MLNPKQLNDLFLEQSLKPYTSCRHKPHPVLNCCRGRRGARRVPKLEGETTNMTKKTFNTNKAKKTYRDISTIVLQFKITGEALCHYVRLYIWDN